MIHSPSSTGRKLALTLAGVTATTGTAAVALVLLPPFSWTVWQYALLTLEFSLFLALAAAFGTALALACTRSEHRRAPIALTTINATVLLAALVPSATLWSTARDTGTELSPTEYTAGLATSTDRDPTTLVYTTLLDQDGTHDLELDIWEATTPPEEPLPVVVNVHGGAEDLPQSLLPRWDTWLADEGHIVVEVDYRYFPDGRWSVPVADVRCALGWVHDNIADHGGDPDRIALTGQSAGGLLTLLAAYTPEEDITPSCEVPHVEPNAVIAWYSVTDGTADAPEVPWRQRHSPIGQELLESSEDMVGGSLDQRPEEYAAMSPIEHIRPELPPTLLLMSGHDLFLDVEDNRRFAARLDEHGVEHQLVELPWTEHMFDLNWGGFASQIARHQIGSFLDQHLAHGNT